MSETLGDRLPEAIRRMSDFLGSEKTRGLDNEFIRDLMTLLAAAKDYQELSPQRLTVQVSQRLMELVSRIKVGDVTTHVGSGDHYYSAHIACEDWCELEALIAPFRNKG